MKNFDHIEFNHKSNRLLACGFDEYGQYHKTPIFRLSSICTEEDRVIVFDNHKSMFVLKTTGREETLEKLEELKAVIEKHKKCASNYMP